MSLENRELSLMPVREHLPDYTWAGDGRRSLSVLYENYERLVTKGGWTKSSPYFQTMFTPKELIQIPVYAYTNFQSDNQDSPPVVDGIFIGGIHGREPAGSNTFAANIDLLIAAGKKAKIVLLPACNTFGYFQNQRYGPLGISVGECEGLLRNCSVPPSPEAKRLTDFLKRFNFSQAFGLDLHEDPIFENPCDGSHNSGTYIYVVSETMRESELTKAVLEVLRENGVPLIEEGTAVEREGIGDLKIIDGVVVGGEDGSLDEWLSFQGVELMITVECLLDFPRNPPLAKRVSIYSRLLEKIFNLKNWL